MDIDKLISDNIGLLYKQLHKYNMVNDEDAYSVGLEALANAAMTFDDSKNVKFSTYATVCIYNAIGVYLRNANRKKQLDVVMYEDAIPGTEDLKYLDTLTTGDTPEGDYLKQELYAKLWEAFDRVYARLTSENEKLIISSWRESEFLKTQTEIANEVGVSQSHVGRTIQLFKYRLKKELEEYVC